eukprot:SAG31_NODE_3159_length_4609_cov_3.554324_3_plen_63_part_00
MSDDGIPAGMAARVSIGSGVLVSDSRHDGQLMTSLTTPRLHLQLLRASSLDEGTPCAFVAKI